ncbi:MAG: glycogen synthase GlgA [Pseudomonadota bacterium]|nr:glycogen synthase GlgA [Pseudomonadota bacterium]
MAKRPSGKKKTPVRGRKAASRPSRADAKKAEAEPKDNGPASASESDRAAKPAPKAPPTKKDAARASAEPEADQRPGSAGASPASKRKKVASKPTAVGPAEESAVSKAAAGAKKPSSHTPPKDFPASATAAIKQEPVVPIKEEAASAEESSREAATVEKPSAEAKAAPEALRPVGRPLETRFAPGEAAARASEGPGDEGEAAKSVTLPSVSETPTPVVAPAPPESVHVEEPVPDEEPVRYEEPAPQVQRGHSLFIVHITPEMAPVAKVGGLADVVFGLTRELAIRGNHVEIILPKYDNLRYDQISELHEVYNDLWVPWYDGAVHCTVYFGFVHDRKCFFIEPHSQDNFFNRGSIYGFNDDVLRYAFFSRAAMEFLLKAGKQPDIIHCHDWQTALAPVFLYEIYQHLGMTHSRVCLTIHNFKHQGVTGMEVLRATGLHQPERYFDYNRLRDNNHAQALNLLKGGIVYSNFVTTVSPRYAFETKDQGQGFGLEPTLHTHHMKYGGVVNGIDYDVWNPEIDWHIPVRFGVDSIDGKYDNKRALRHRLMLADNDKPIVAFIGRLDPQKGLELVRHAIFYSLERGAQFVLLGSSPDQGINADFWGLKGMLNDSPDCHLEIGFDEDLAHLIYAGADMMLVPSRFEPCGLTQLISLRYGTVPVVRSVGGLADTVFDKDHSNRPLHERNGYVFENYDQPGLESALERAIACYFNHPDHFRELMKNAMHTDYSWNIPGEDYLNIYDYIRSK